MTKKLTTEKKKQVVPMYVMTPATPSKHLTPQGVGGGGKKK